MVPLRPVWQKRAAGTVNRVAHSPCLKSASSVEHVSGIARNTGRRGACSWYCQEYRAILSEFRAILSECRAILSESRAILSEYRAILSEHRAILSEYQAIL
eukprot:652828-Prorocentrum_minimum.AAC.1